jgi:hypothetical protein
MITLTVRRLVMAFLAIIAAYLILGSTLTGNTQTVEGLARLIPREKWDEAGLNKLTVPEQQILSGDITTLLAAARTTSTKDRSQWRKLRRHMTKDDVRNLLGEPNAVSVSGFAESWYYVDGSLAFDGKGRLDMWSEL